MSGQQATTDDEYLLHCGMSGYLDAVSVAAGVGPESATMDLDSPMSAYLALDGQLAVHPGRDTALVWDERHGWSFTIETHSGEDLLVVAYLGDDLVPPPSRVREFVRAVRALTRRTPPPAPPELNRGRADLLARLLGYRTPQPLSSQ
ncbi:MULTISPECIES: DUF6292 family protein [unclassified Amycolatopsis]|uniref:DUF6292 family protein n=1 Tax=unclassified Amycolatopsis TaxID=2618356 RepID=UPI001EE7A540|nr:DUF6292 family protein [Amycolatopsis sp. Poz14]MCG3754106.1 hypothetical protein [Amycolatopsis sp. Poz14]